LRKFIVLEGQEDSYKIEFEHFLFNEERHRESQTQEDWNTFSLINSETKTLAAQIHFQIKNQVAESPHSAPFGSVEFIDGLNPESLIFFLDEIERRLKEEGVIKILIKDTPHQYRPQQSTLLCVLLLNSGFGICKEEINSGIIIDHRDWETKISHAELKRLKKCRNEGLEFRLLDIEKMEAVYKFIKSCREEREMSLSMTWPQLMNTARSCKNDFVVFGVFRKNEMIAASISIKINQRILYDFYHAHSKSTDQLSPVVSLIDGMYSYCRENNFELLDLGTSSLNDKINFSLLNFKTQIAGESSLKLTFVKDLN
jgi:hypothetical protein